MSASLAPLLVALSAATQQGSAPAPVLPSDQSLASVVLGDLDDDGYEELLLLLPQGGDRLLRNLGDGQFEDVTESAFGTRAVGSVAAWIEDLDLDGRRDVLRLDARGRLHLERNEGALYFRNQTADAGLATVGSVRSLQLLDYDRDSRADLLLAGDSGHTLYHNSEESRFERVALPSFENPSLPAPSAASEAGHEKPFEGDEGGMGMGIPGGGDPPSSDGGRGSSTPGGSSGEEPDRPGLGAPGSGGSAGGGGPTITPQPGGSASGSPPTTMVCADGVVDQAGGPCFMASSQPTLDHLYPLSLDFNIDPAGHVGMGTLTPSAALHVKEEGSGEMGALVEQSATTGSASGLRVHTSSSDAHIAISAVAFANTGDNVAVSGRAVSGSGTGVYGEGQGFATGLGPAKGVHGLSRTDQGIGVLGVIENPETTAAASGVEGQASAPLAVGVRGKNTSSTGQAFGVYGTTDSDGGIGVAALATATTGDAAGVVAQTQADSGIGAQGVALHSTGQTKGVHGHSLSPDGVGVYGENSSVSGTAAGVVGASPSPNGVGVGARCSSTTGSATAVNAQTEADLGAGVYGLALHATGQTKGVWGDVYSPNGVGVYGENSSNSGTAAGVVGASPSPDGVGVGARCSSPTGSATAVNAQTEADLGAGVYGLALHATGQTKGVWGDVLSSSGVGVYGNNDGSSGFATGVKGVAGNADSGIGVWGVGDYAGIYGRGGTNTNFGILGVGENDPNHIGVAGIAGSAPSLWLNAGVSGGTDRGAGYGVAGMNLATTGRAHAIFGQSFSSDGEGVEGEGWTGVAGRQSVTGGGGGYGVVGYASTPLGDGVVGATDSTSASTPILNDAGVLGVTEGPSGYAVAGLDSGTSSGASAVYGESRSVTGGYGVYGKATMSGTAVFSDGNLTVGGGGTKSFVHPHPKDASKQIRFVCLEGNESGTYFRGSSSLAGGLATVAVPEAFRLVTEAEGLTVQVTPRGPASLWVAHVDLNVVEIRGSADVEFDYFVNGVRAGYADFEPIETNTAYRPQQHSVPYGEHMNPHFQRLLIENGTLNADLTPNVQTAASLGWELRDGTEGRALTLGSDSRPGSEVTGRQARTVELPPEPTQPPSSLPAPSSRPSHGRKTEPSRPSMPDFDAFGRDRSVGESGPLAPIGESGKASISGERR